MKLQAMIYGALEVPEDPFQHVGVRLPWVVHMQTRLLHGIGDVWPGEGEVLKGTCDAPIIRGVVNRFSRGRKLRVRVDGSAAGITMSHAGTSKNILNVLSLGQKQTISCPGDSHTKKEVKVSKISHGKLTMKMIKELL